MRNGAPSRQEHLAVASLIKICEELLQRSPIAPDDNFFELGGDSVLAAALCRAVQEATDQTLPLAAIYEAPTVAALARELERISPRFRSLVLLKQGDGEPPLFLAAGAGGGLIRFSQLARRLSFNHPVYTIETHVADKTQPRVEDISKSFLRTLRARQPHGPYLLAGHSFGGLVALEVAQSLIRLGEEVSLLALLDTYPHPLNWRLGSWIIVMMRITADRLSDFRRLGVREMLPELWKRFGNLIAHVRARLTGCELLTMPNEFVHLPEDMRVALERDILAWNRYRPRPYPGKITFLKAETASGLWPSDPVMAWGGLAKSLEIHTVPGDHSRMLTTHSAALGERLSRCLEGALAAMQARAPKLGEILSLAENSAPMP